MATFTEFFCDYSAGSNLNSGQDNHSSPTPRLTYAAGSWVSTTGVFTVASGNPLSAGVVVGDYASVYATGATVTGFVGRVTARDATTITVSLTAKAGTAPSTGTGTRELRIGGCWKGPNAAVAFPLGFMHSALNNGTNLTPRVNFHSGTNYTITSGITHNVTDNGPLFFQGYTSVPGDGGFAHIQGPATGTSMTIFTMGSIAGTTCRRMWVENFSFSGNGDSSQTGMVVFASVLGVFRRCHGYSARGAAWATSGNGQHLIECSATNCNVSATANIGTMSLGGNVFAIRCVTYDNNTSGLYTGQNGLTNTLVHQLSVLREYRTRVSVEAATGVEWLLHGDYRLRLRE